MKFLIIALATIFSASALACTDFSGTFRNDDGSISTITQNACESLTITQDQISYTLINDGKSHLSLEHDLVIDGRVVGHFQMYSSMSFVDSTIVVDTTMNVVDMSGSQTDTSHAVSSLNSDGDLVSLETNNGETKTTTTFRVK